MKLALALAVGLAWGSYGTYTSLAPQTYALSYGAPMCRTPDAWIEQQEYLDQNGPEPWFRWMRARGSAIGCTLAAGGEWVEPTFDGNWRGHTILGIRSLEGFWQGDYYTSAAWIEAPK